MAEHGKRYRKAAEGLDRDQLFAPVEAIKMLKSFPSAKFDESVELSMRLGVDPRKPDQSVRGAVSLPKGTGKTMRVVAFAKGEKAKAAEAAGADVIGDDDLVERISGGWLEFDAVVATPDMMPVVSKLGRVLGPRGLMPNPKSGTVTDDISRAVSNIKAGQVEYRTDKYGNVHLIIGKKSFSEADLAANYLTVLDEIHRAKPAASKGRYVRSIAISTTMGPGIRIDPQRSKDIAEALEAAASS